MVPASLTFGTKTPTRKPGEIPGIWKVVMLPVASRRKPGPNPNVLYPTTVPALLMPVTMVLANPGTSKVVKLPSASRR